MKAFAEILLPLNLPGTFTYEIPPLLINQAAVGKRVIVPFGKQKLYSGIIVHLKNESDYALTKEIVDIIDESPVLNTLHLQFWQWISDYYLCNVGEVMQAGMPTGIKFDSETFFSLLKQPEYIDILSEQEQIIIEALRHRSFAIKDIQKLLGKKTVYPAIKKLLNDGIITGDEVLKNQYKVKTETFYQLTNSLNHDELNELINNWGNRAAKQLEVLNEIIFLSNVSPLIAKKELKEKFTNTDAALKKLIERNIIEEIYIQKGRLPDEKISTIDNILLSGIQQKAYNAIQECFQQHEVTLLHGVTASGKTHVYIKLIEDMLQKKMQVLYLLPEIALTSQIIRKLRSYFGNQVGVYHSKFNPNERVEIWNKVLNEEYKIIIGVRSSIFLPFQHLGLIIVDEEHDGSYKQHDPAPRYHARDAAVMLAKLTDAKVVLGTATPSLESYLNAIENKYGLVNMNQRFMNVNMPEILVVNTKEALRKKQMQSHFTNKLTEEINNTLNIKEQVILFLNRRGYSPFIECSDCSHVPKCKNCDVSLTYHKHINKLKCHLCGYVENNPARCSACGSHNLKMVGMGTEKIEDEIQILFPSSKIDRLDIDTARGKEAHQNIIEKFERYETDILVGTQMLSKGLDFDKVRLVGVINVDQMLNYPDFRSGEKTFQLVSQVSGRAGRKDGKGIVILQTSRPNHPIIQFAAAHDYGAYYQHEIEQRRQFFYPPFSRIIKITLKHKELSIAQQATHQFIKHIILPFAVKKLGPITPVISRVKNMYLQEVVFKIPKNNVLLQSTKEKILLAIREITQNTLLKGVYFHIDVDAN